MTASAGAVRFQAGHGSRLLQPGAAFGRGGLCGWLCGLHLPVVTQDQQLLFRLDVLGLEGPEDTSPCLDKRGDCGNFCSRSWWHSLWWMKQRAVSPLDSVPNETACRSWHGPHLSRSAGAYPALAPVWEGGEDEGRRVMRTGGS